MKKKILLLSPYDVASHQYWWKGLEKHLPEYQWTILSLPPRYFAWRMRGNSITWAYEQKHLLEQDYDLIIACSMTDLSSLRGFIPRLASIATLIYCHENQFYYPTNSLQQGNIEQQIIQLYSFECADKIVFNSEFNYTTCLTGIKALLKKLPDHVPKNLLNNIKTKCHILEVPIDEQELIPVNKNQEFTITWNHRWEYDKGLKQLYYLIKKISNSCSNSDAALNIDFKCKINILGHEFRQVPEDMNNILELLKSSKCQGHIGFIENRTEYLNVLSKSHVVLSTSLHEFQGLAIMEAVKLNCIPVLPNRLSYPNFFPESYLYESCLEDPEQESESAFGLLKHIYQQWQLGKLKNQTELMDSLPSWHNKKPAYQAIIERSIDRL